MEAIPTENVRIWLRPGRYYLKESIKIDRTPLHKVSLASMTLPSNVYNAPPDLPCFESSSDCASVERLRNGKKRRGQGLLKYILCTSTAYNAASVEEGEESVASDQESTATQPPDTPLRATLVLRTRRLNEPAIRVQRGHFAAQNINVEHSSHGLDIWNGNAAIQIQPPQIDPDGPPPLLALDECPVADLSGIGVTSRSGRGVVTIDGGQLSMKNSCIYECAATGIYIGGRGTLSCWGGKLTSFITTTTTKMWLVIFYSNRLGFSFLRFRHKSDSHDFGRGPERVGVTRKSPPHWWHRS